jgi:hypothetical protein
MPKDWRYFEGTTSANSILTDLGKVLCTAVKDDEIVDENGVVVKPKKVIKERNWDVTYPAVDWDKLKAAGVDVLDRNDLTPEEFAAKINQQLSGVTDTVILKTKTTPVTVEDTGMSDLGLEDDLAADSIDMYMEIYKPRYLANPEQYHPEAERFGIKPYNITRGIYEEFASTTGHKKLNVIEEFISQDPAHIETYDRPIKGTRTAYSYYYHYNDGNPSSESPFAKATRWALREAGLVGTLNHYPTRSINEMLKYEISELAGDEKSFIQTLLGTSYDLEDFETVTIAVYNYYSDRYRFAVEAKTIVKEWKIARGAKFTLPESETLKLSSLTFAIGDQGDLGQSAYSYNLTSGELEVLKDIPDSGWAREDQGVPTVQYDYEKEQAVITRAKPLYNNHHIYMRIFDVLEDRSDRKNYLKGPKENEIDKDTGEITTIHSHISEWSKLAWYQDYEEVMADELDSDVGVADLSQGIVLLPIETPGLNGDTRIRMWANTSNNRVLLTLMGNPSLDFSANRHLTSMAYMGKIESFENSINDTAGNFALFTSSSTVPCSTKTTERRVSTPTSEYLGVVSVAGQDTFPLNMKSIGKNVYVDGNIGMSVKYLDKSIDPNNPTETILLAEDNLFTVNIAEDKKSLSVTLLAPPTSADIDIYLNFNYYEDKVENVDGIVRDSFGSILEIRYPETWGKNTATGVTDIAMYHTRSKAYFQKHHFMFTTTEEYMTKEMYGKSAYTGEYYADRVKITHGNDGPRGMLEDMLVIDQSSLVALDELIVNREFSKNDDKPEETFVYFPINAPFSPFAGSPNAMYGVAMKKEMKLPPAVDEAQAVERVVADLYIGKTTNITEDLFLPTELGEDCTITWASSDITVCTIVDPS